jgi:hypothetical protein
VFGQAVQFIFSSVLHPKSAVQASEDDFFLSISVASLYPILHLVHALSYPYPASIA